LQKEIMEYEMWEKMKTESEVWNISLNTLLRSILMKTFVFPGTWFKGLRKIMNSQTEDTWLYWMSF
jgi:hypothetical protein